MFDRDGNGYITRDELQTAMEMIQESVTENQVTEMLALADLDKDGKINYEGKHANCCDCLRNGLFFWYFCICILMVNAYKKSPTSEFLTLLLRCHYVNDDSS